MAEEETFEHLFAALEERARKLEAGGLPLEDAVTTYEEGAAIAGKLKAVLQAAELRIRHLDQRLAEERWELDKEPTGFDEDFEDENDD